MYTTVIKKTLLNLKVMTILNNNNTIEFVIQR